jgi:TldD protein
MKTAPAASVTRAPFAEDLKPLRKTLNELLPSLQAKPDWYASIFFERKASRTFVANLKQTQLADQVRMGVVLRIYDGCTLFEQATDDLSTEALQRTAQAFAKRVTATQPPAGAPRHPYSPPTWEQRLSVKLENEITSQIPKDVQARTPVHFGIAYGESPKALSAAKRLERLKAIVDQLKKTAPDHGLKSEELTYALARQGFWEEESIFIDRESDLSQTIYRQNVTIVAMSGADRVHLALGGLGGMEAVAIPEKELGNLLTDLKALKQAERLTPGKYRVLMGPVVSGVLAHEAFGHAQEGDTCARGRSKAWEIHLREKSGSGETVGNDLATILNNPAVFENAGQPYAAWGSYFFDEEGWLAQEQVLLDRGKLLAPMTNLTSAIRLGVPRTANGKRESWANGVYTRQTNTYFSAGDRTLPQLMKELGDGFVATHPAGGMEDPKGMGIQVGISYLQEVKNGSFTGRVFKGPAGGDIQMTGYTPDVLNSIVAKSKIEVENSAPDTARFPFNDPGGCGKYHKEIVFAGCGGPYMLMDGVILG